MAEGGDSKKGLLDVVDDYITLAEDLILRSSKLSHVEGAMKFERKCRAELKFLKKLKLRKDLTESHVRSSNLNHLNGIIMAAETLPLVTHMVQPYHYKVEGDEKSKSSVLVDVVCQNRSCWVKVIARKAQGLHSAWTGQGHFGQRNIANQGLEYIDCAKQNLVKYTAPKVAFLFLSGVTEPIVNELQTIGILVHGEKYLIDHVDIVSDQDVGDQFESDTSEEELELSDTDENVNDKKKSDAESNVLALPAFEAGVPVKQGSNTDLENLSPEFDLSTLEQGVPTANEFSNEVKGSAISDFCSHELGRITLENFDEDEFCESMRLVLQNLNVTLDSDEAQGDFKCNTSVSMDTHSVYNPSSSRSFQDEQSEPIVRQTLPSSLLPGLPKVSVINKVNLDITTLLSMVSNVTHGGCNFVFKEAILTSQAAQERRAPLMPILTDYLSGKDLYACETAVKDFQSILNTVGGPKEKKRAEVLMQRVQVIPDVLSEKSKKLKVTGHIKDRAKVIFGVGDGLQAVTATANKNFVRAADHQNVSFVVFLHEPRALTEQKEKTATPIPALPE